MSEHRMDIMMDRAAAVVLLCCCCCLSGCTSLVLAERERALTESFEKGKISKVQYLLAKNELQEERERKAGVPARQ